MSIHRLLAVLVQQHPGVGHAATGLARAQRAAQLAVADQSVDATDVRLAYAPAGAGCGAAGVYAPALVPGEEFSVCATVTVPIPLLPEFVDADTTTGQVVAGTDHCVDLRARNTRRTQPDPRRRAPPRAGCGVPGCRRSQAPGRTRPAS